MSEWDAFPVASSESGPTRITVHPLPREPLQLDPRSRDMAIRTVLGEAAEEPDEGQAAVAAVIRNRLESGKFGKSVPHIVLAPKQFEPWGSQDGRNRMMGFSQESEPYKRAAASVDAIFGGTGDDPTGGAVNFYNPELNAKLAAERGDRRAVPTWDNGKGQRIGRHVFFGGSTDVSSQAKRPAASDPWAAFPAAEQAAPTEETLPSSSGLPGGFGPRKGREDRQVGAAEALGRGAAQGVTANFYDELRGLVEAGGVNPNDPASLSALLSGAVKYWTGDPEAARRYETAKKREQAAAEEAQTQRPVLSTVGNVAGAVAVPVGGLMQAPTTAARVGRSVAVGAGYGAAAGAGDGEGADRLTGAATGGAIGAGAGAVAVPAIAALGAAGRGAAALARPLTTAVRGAFNPEAEAARRVVGAVTRDIQSGSAEMAPQQVMAAGRAGAPVANLDMGGEATRALARSAANTSAEGRATLQNLADARFEGQADRATQFVRNLVGGPVDTAATREALRNTARNVNRPAYEAAYRHPSAQGMWDEGFEQIAQAPVVQNAIRAASITAANRGTVDGLPRIASPFTVDRASGQLTLRTNPDGSRMLPNLQFWDHVKRNLDQISTPEARALNNALKQHLDDIVPDYRAARAGAARFFDADDALTAGENFVRQNVGLGEARRALAAMSAEERELFRQGFAARLIDDVNGTRDRVNVLNKIGESPQARAKLQMALGPQGYQRVEAFLTVEQTMDRLRGALGNSTTSRQLFEMGMAGGANAGLGAGAYGVATGNWDSTSLLAGALWAGAKGKIDQRVSRRVAEMLASNDPQRLARGISMVSGNRALRQAFRDLDERLARIGAQQAPAPSMLQAAGVGRAEDE